MISDNILPETSKILNECLNILYNKNTLNVFEEISNICKNKVELDVAQKIYFSIVLHENTFDRLLEALNHFHANENWEYAKIISSNIKAFAQTESLYEKLIYEVEEREITSIDARLLGNKEVEYAYFSYQSPKSQSATLMIDLSAVNLESAEDSERQLNLVSAILHSCDVAGNMSSQVPTLWLIETKDVDPRFLDLLQSLADLLLCQIVLLEENSISPNTNSGIRNRPMSLGPAQAVRIRKHSDRYSFLNLTGVQLWPCGIEKNRVETLESVLLFSAAFHWIRMYKLVISNTDFEKHGINLTNSFNSTIKQNGTNGHMIYLMNLLFSKNLINKILWKSATYFQNKGYYNISLELLNHLPSSYSPKYLGRRIMSAYFGIGLFSKAVEIGNTSKNLTGKYLSQFNEARAAVELEQQLQVAMPVISSSANAASDLGNGKGKVVSILHASAPHQSGGYANRAHGLLSELVRQGYEVAAYTRPGFPETKSFFKDSDHQHSRVDDINYHHHSSSIQRRKGEYQYMLASVEYYSQVFENEKPDIIHLRSTYVSALPALIAAKNLGIPCVYEISGMWELVYEGIGDARRESMRARTVHFENLVCSFATKIVTVTDAMRNILIRRGFSESIISLVPNAVNVADFRPQPKDSRLLKLLDWDESIPVIGYLGTFVEYEGLEVLVRALRLLKDQNQEFYALLVGDGEQFEIIKELVINLGLEDQIHMPGRVPHDAIPSYYSIVDVSPFPRLRTPATEAVSPLKPFEAMASAKTVVVSDLPALQEIVGYGERGLICESGNAESLASVISECFKRGPLIEQIVHDAIRWIDENRSWQHVGKLMSNALDSVNPANSKTIPGRNYLNERI